MTRAKIPVDLTKNNDIVQMFHKNKTILSLDYLGIRIFLYVRCYSLKIIDQ